MTIERPEDGGDQRSAHLKFEAHTDPLDTFVEPDDDRVEESPDRLEIGEVHPETETFDGSKGDEQGDEKGEEQGEEEGPVRPTLQEVLLYWTGNTSIHGIPWMANQDTNSHWFRYLWGLLVFTAAGVMCWQIGSIVKEYQQYELSTSTKVKWPGEIEFPDVTFCNWNKYLESAQKRFNITDPRNETELRMITQPLENFIVYTEFNHQPVTNLSAVWHERITDFGRCWTFRTDEKVKLPSWEGGLEVFMDIDQSDYDPFISPFAGAMVFVSQQENVVSNQIPFSVAKAGKMTITHISNTFYSRETKQPWSYCIGEAPAYTAAKCRIECLNRHIREQCNCRRVGDEIDTFLDFCTEKDPGSCRLGVNKTAALENCPFCLPACVEKRYSTSASDISFSRSFLDTLSASIKNFNWTAAHFLDDFVGVHVNFENINYSETEEDPEMSFNALLAAIGGSMGLFLGISVLSLVELGDFLCIRLFPWWFHTVTRIATQKHGLGKRKKDAKSS